MPMFVWVLRSLTQKRDIDGQTIVCMQEIYTSSDKTASENVCTTCLRNQSVTDKQADGWREIDKQQRGEH